MCVVYGQHGEQLFEGQCCQFARSCWICRPCRRHKLLLHQRIRCGLCWRTADCTHVLAQDMQMRRTHAGGGVSIMWWRKLQLASVLAAGHPPLAGTTNATWQWCSAFTSSCADSSSWGQQS